MELKSRITPVVILLFLFYVGFSVQATAQKSGTGSIVGTVKDKNSENPLPAAKVTVDGTLLTAIADSVGQYRLAGVPTGDHTLRISYIGYNDSSVDVNVKEEEALEVDVLLLPYMRLTVEVTAPYLEGQERALNEQNASLKIENVVAADQIGNFPDQNAAEALQRIPGITLERDQGEGRYVLIRGTSPNLTSISINGQQIPSPETDTRYVALDVIPADLLEFIQANPLNEDLSKYELDELSREKSYTENENYAVELNVRSPLPIGWLKFGGKYRYETKYVRAPVNLLDWPGTYNLQDSMDPNFNPSFFLGQYNTVDWEFSSPAWGRDLADSPGITSEIDHSEDGNDYDAAEKISAGYVMANFGGESKISVIPGFRYEYTQTEYMGNDVQFDEDGDWLSTTAVTRGHDYGAFLPGINFVYRFEHNINLRFAVTRSIARPNFSDLPPKYIIDHSGPSIEMGNPDLKPTRSTNLDIMAEHYFASVGVASMGYFYKWITSPIYPFFSLSDMGGEEFEVTQPMNGQEAHVQGLEMAFQRQLNFLPSFMSGFGLYANYTYVDSEALFPPSEVDGSNRTATLPGQAKHVGNFGFSYEKYGFSGRLIANYHGKYLDEVSDTATNDIWFDDHIQLDLSLSQRLAKHVRVFADFVNLNGEPLRSYQGAADRPVQREYYSWWGTFGLKLDF